MIPLKLQNWTIPATPATPDVGHAREGQVQPFPCLMGTTNTYRRINARWEEAGTGECCVLEPTDIYTSEIVKVHRDAGGVKVTCRSGNVYQLVGNPRPSFYRHLRAFGLEQGPDAVAELVRRLKVNLT